MQNNQSLNTLLGISKLGTAIILTISFVSAVFLCFMIFQFASRLFSNSDSFCQLDDDAFQVITDNHDEWIEFFTSQQNQSFSLYPQFTVNGRNRTYGVVPEYGENSDQILLFYVSTKPGWSNTPQGARGYIYMVNDHVLSDFWQKEYNISQLSTTVFCYVKN